MSQRVERLEAARQLALVLLHLRALRSSLGELERRHALRGGSDRDLHILWRARRELDQAFRLLQEALPATLSAPERSALPEQASCCAPGCEEPGEISHGAFSLCRRHSDEWQQRRWRWCVACFAEDRWRQVRPDEPSGRCAAHGGHDYVVPALPGGLPIPGALAQHGLPADMDAAGVEEALTQAGLPPFPEEVGAHSLSPRCFWETDGQGCLEPRLAGASFCARHRPEGERRLAEETRDRPARISRLLLGIASRGLVPALFSFFAQAAAQEESQGEADDQSAPEPPEDLSDRPACVAGDCEERRLRGHALCAEHLRSLTASRGQR